MKVIDNLKEKIKNKDYVGLILFALLVAVVASGVVNLFTYGIGIYAYDEPDFLEGTMWADATIKSGRLVSTTLYYPYVIPFGSNIFCLPFVLIIGDGLLANQLGMLVYYIIYLVAIMSLAKSLFDDFDKQMIFIIISSMFVYTYLGTNILHHLLYYGISFACLLGILACLINIIKGKNVKNNFIGLALWCIWSSSNGITTTILSNISVFGALTIYYLYKNKNFTFLKEKNSLKLMGCIILSSIIGIVLYKVVTIGVTELGGLDVRFTLLSTADMVQNLIINLPNHYLRCFGISPEGTRIFSLKGIFTLLLIGFALIIIVVSCVAIKKSFRKSNAGFIVTLSGVFISVICLAEYIMTLSNERYLFNIILALLFISAMFVAELSSKGEISKTMILLCLLVFVGMFSLKNGYNYLERQNRYKKRMETINVLYDEGLEYGFAKHSNIWNVLSSNRIKSLPLDEYTNEKEKNNTEMSFYHNRPEGIKKFFVIMPDYKFDIYTDNNKEFVDKAVKTIESNGYYILIYDIDKWNDIKEHEYSIG